MKAVVVVVGFRRQQAILIETTAATAATLNGNIDRHTLMWVNQLRRCSMRTEL